MKMWTARPKLHHSRAKALFRRAKDHSMNSKLLMGAFASLLVLEGLVLNWETTLQIPKIALLSSESTDLILRLCCGAEQRLGRNGADEIKVHPFFASIDFEGGLRNKPAPYIPNIRYPADTSNFDAVDDTLLDKPTPPAPEPNGRHPEHAFFEFTFRRFFDDGGQAYPVRAGTGAALGVTGSQSNDESLDGQGSPVYV
ncbi:hypothetical protein HPB51_001908 [Rhipicephalus microplus]|uniref:non-specific serine/threonine protein kinase n=1 Tax=Rhipicephalus microplus TaxID=6941 RepID=A0A9J6DEQ7_RHIMP|nr:hypothetical protein HPB51_001908 [Rhipicephalus microplus]